MLSVPDPYDFLYSDPGHILIATPSTTYSQIRFVYSQEQSHCTGAGNVSELLYS